MLTRQLKVFQHLPQGLVNGHVTVLPLINEGMHHRYLQHRPQLSKAVGHIAILSLHQHGACITDTCSTDLNVVKAVSRSAVLSLHQHEHA